MQVKRKLIGTETVMIQTNNGPRVITKQQYEDLNKAYKEWQSERLRSKDKQEDPGAGSITSTAGGSVTASRDSSDFKSGPPQQGETQDLDGV